MKIKDLKELLFIGELNEGDILVFGKYEYQVEETFLNCLNGHYNDIIFDGFDRYKFCSEAYGYESDNGLFPVYRDEDYKAAYRVAKKIYTDILKESVTEETMGFNIGDRVKIKGGKAIYTIVKLTDSSANITIDGRLHYKYDISKLELVPNIDNKSKQDIKINIGDKVKIIKPAEVYGNANEQAKKMGATKYNRDTYLDKGTIVKVIAIDTNRNTEFVYLIELEKDGTQYLYNERGLELVSLSDSESKQENILPINNKNMQKLLDQVAQEYLDKNNKAILKAYELSESKSKELSTLNQIACTLSVQVTKLQMKLKSAVNESSIEDIQDTIEEIKEIDKLINIELSKSIKDFISDNTKKKSKNIKLDLPIEV